METGLTQFSTYDFTYVSGNCCWYRWKWWM